MKRSSLLSLASVLFLAISGSARAGTVQDFVNNIKPAYAGSYTQGDIYAHDLYRQLTEHGFKAVLIYFNWGERSSRENQAAFVVYQDEQGRYWGKQSIGSSKWVAGTTPLAWTQSFYNDKVVSVFAVARPVETMVADQ